MQSLKRPLLMKCLPLSLLKAGFSILELVVSVAIIAILLAFSLSTFKNVRQKSDGARCTGNLRTIGSALHTYIVDNNGEYPPNRKNFAHPDPNPAKGNPWVQDGLRPYLLVNQSGTKTRQAAGVWFCPSDTERPMDLSAHSYGQGYYLGADDRPTEAVPAYRPWWSKPSASPLSGQLIYLIDHDTVKTPKRTAGIFERVSWPLYGGRRGEEGTLPNDTPYVHFRHADIANALFVDGSVRALRFEDLVNTKLKYIKIPD